ncbi:MAG: hypothetical protein RLZZ612_1295 [Pseudomonadota bacterium]
MLQTSDWKTNANVCRLVITLKSINLINVMRRKKNRFTHWTVVFLLVGGLDSGRAWPAGGAVRTHGAFVPSSKLSLLLSRTINTVGKTVESGRWPCSMANKPSTNAKPAKSTGWRTVVMLGWT